MKSYYLVTLGLTGGIYRDDQFAYGSLTDLQQALEVEFWGDLREGMGCVLSYDHVPLTVFEAGGEKQRINLRPFLTLHGPDGFTFRLPASGLTHDLKPNRRWVLRGTDVVTDEAFRAVSKLSLDWGAVPLVPLNGPFLGDREEIPDADDEDEDRTRIKAGYFNYEGDEDDDAEFRGLMEQAIGFDPLWAEYNGGAARALAKTMHRTGDYSAMPVLADALEEAGCASELVLWHCRSPTGVHARGSWLVERLRRA